MLLKVKFLGHEIGYRNATIHKFPSPTVKVALMRFKGTLNFYTKFIKKRHIIPKPFYDFLHENTLWNWTSEHIGIFSQI